MKFFFHKILILFCCVLLFNSCKKSTFTPVQVTYTVKVVAGNKVSIEYNSDKYFTTGARESIVWTSNGTTWFANRIAEQEEDYYIQVKYLDAPNLEDNYNVKVILNDTNIVASSVNDTIVPEVTLQGRVTN